MLPIYGAYESPKIFSICGLPDESQSIMDFPKSNDGSHKSRHGAPMIQSWSSIAVLWRQKIMMRHERLMNSIIRQ